jgi:hypothetical protein
LALPFTRADTVVGTQNTDASLTGTATPVASAPPGAPSSWMSWTSVPAFTQLLAAPSHTSVVWLQTSPAAHVPWPVPVQGRPLPQFALIAQPLPLFVPALQMLFSVPLRQFESGHSALVSHGLPLLAPA